MVDRRVPAPAGAPNPTPPPKFGEDALSYVLGSSSVADEPDDRAKIAGVLAAAPDQPIHLFELSKRADVDFVHLSRVLQEMEDSGAVAVEGEPGSETVRAVS